jgi:hypothetical protein
MLLYNKHIDKYATLISRDGDHCTVQYQGDTQAYVVPCWEFEDTEPVHTRSLISSRSSPSKSS